jgi:hypothetical protein
MMNHMNRLRFLRNGRVRRISYDEPELEIVAENQNTRVITLKRKGYSTNHSGIRGLRDDVYNPMAFLVLRETSPVWIGNATPDRFGMEADTELLIEWEPRGK